MVDAEEIKKEGIRLIEEFSERLKDLPDSEETHYVVDVRNVTRKDSEADRQGLFSRKFKELAPRVDEEYVLCEKNIQ